jgi:hypothetical protein
LLDVSAFREVLPNNLVCYRFNEPLPEDFLRLSDHSLLVFQNLLKPTFLSQFNEALILDLSLSEEDDEYLLILDATGHEDVPHEMCQFLGCASIVVVPNAHEFLDRHHSVLLEVVVQALLGACGVVGGSARGQRLREVLRCISDLLQTDEGVLFLLQLRLLLLDLFLVLEEQEGIVFDPGKGSETSLWRNHLLLLYLVKLPSIST